MAASSVRRAQPGRRAQPSRRAQPGRAVLDGAAMIAKDMMAKDLPPPRDRERSTHRTGGRYFVIMRGRSVRRRTTDS
jgi:hypothetical protein